MQIREAIVLAGGLGTRLRSAVPELPKCMAPVNDRPFISYVINHLQKQGVDRFVFSLGYRSEAFTSFLSETLSEKNYQVVIEAEPLGTGGAIQYAFAKTVDTDTVVVNGDSIFSIDLPELASFHESRKAECTLALKAMTDFDRYGVVELNDDGSIALFREKQWVSSGLINGGVYLLNKASFLQKDLPLKFSFETDYLQRFYPERKIYGMKQDGYFIDIGIPEDYQRAKLELK